MDASAWISLGSVAVALLALIVGVLGWRKAGEANRLAAESNDIAQGSKRVAEEANRIATEANAYVARATEIAAESFDHERQRDLESKSSDIQFPEGEKGSIWFKEQNGPMVIVAIPLHNVGLGTARNILPEAAIDKVPFKVEGNPIGSLKHDESIEQAFWLRLHVDDQWIPPEGKTIQLTLNYSDGTGPRITERCFRFHGPKTSRWKSQQFPCYSSGPSAITGTDT